MRFRIPAVSLAAVVILAAAEHAAASWQPNGTPIVSSPGPQTNFSTVADGAGGFYLIWQDASAWRAVRVQGSADLAPGWPAEGVPLQISPQEMVASADPVTGLILAWTSGTSVHALRLSPDGTFPAGWSDTGILLDSRQPGPDGESYYNPYGVSDHAGGALVYWQDRGCDNGLCWNVVWFTRFDGSGNIVTPATQHYAQSCTPGCDQGLIVVPDGQGDAFVAIHRFEDHRLMLSKVPAPGHGGWVRPPVLLNGDRYSVVRDGTGGVFVTWKPWDGSGSQVTVLRVGANGANPGGWQAGGNVVDLGIPVWDATGGGPDGTGGLVLAYLDNNIREQYLQRIRYSGPDPDWPPEGLRIAPTRCEIGEDGTGGLFATWVQSDDIYAQHVLVDGSLDPECGATGSVVCSASGAQTFPRIVPASDGEVFVSWVDDRPGPSTPDIYAQRVSCANITPLAVTGESIGHGLLSARPNPSRGGSINVEFNLSRAERVRLSILDLQGRELQVLRDGEHAAGRHQVLWSGARDVHRAQGVYFIRFERNGSASTIRVVITR